MAQLRSYEITVDGVPAQVLEAGPVRSSETVIILGADDEQAIQLVLRLGRFTRAVSVASGQVLEALDVGSAHVVIALNENSDLDVVVELLQRSIDID